jgi:hypothetical protein
MNKLDTRAGRGRSVLLWILAIAITVPAVVYQRRVGPTRPVSGVATIEGETLRYRFQRSAPGPSDYKVEVPFSMPTIGEMLRGRRSERRGPVLDPAIRGILMQRRYNTDDPWTFTPMRREEGRLVGEVQLQPPGGKVAYRVHLFRTEGAAANESPDGSWALRRLTAEDIPAGAVAMPAAGPVVVRFTGHVPAAILIPHVLLMFLGMLWANRAGLEALRRGADPTRLTRGALDLLLTGGFIFGPLMQKFAFGQFWTGIPFGWDLTDNKTLFAVLSWILAWYLLRRARKRGDVSRARIWVVIAAVFTMAVFSIPHSAGGSELDYSTGKVKVTTTR